MRDTRFDRIRRIKWQSAVLDAIRRTVFHLSRCQLFSWAATASDGQCVRHVFDIPERRFGITMKRDG